MVCLCVRAARATLLFLWTTGRLHHHTTVDVKRDGRSLELTVVVSHSSVGVSVGGVVHESRDGCDPQREICVCEDESEAVDGIDVAARIGAFQLALP
ncbi:uncharacterized protein IWZ02DRAFT_73865 [Phyllosticta citriasiana]|uniref:Secreted protein n=1 Tax=Phyllosticta citriasiana TaxID=595635 RepID=A0ABR1KVP0_9PEZI